jgi:hypothetical protein
MIDLPKKPTSEVKEFWPHHVLVKFFTSILKLVFKRIEFILTKVVIDTPSLAPMKWIPKASEKSIVFHPFLTILTFTRIFV